MKTTRRNDILLALLCSAGISPWTAALAADPSTAQAAPQTGTQTGGKTEEQTIVQQRLQSLERLIPLRKMTVGPDDQYQGIATSDGSRLIFTRKSDLVPHLCVQDQRTGLAEPFISMTADSQEASLNGQDRVAFVYFRKSAAGDICHRSLDAKRGDDSGIECVETTEGERASPFWRSSSELGFLVRNPRSESNKVLVQNIKTGVRSLLAEGSVWSPFMHPGGKTLVTNEAITENGREERVLSIRPVSGDEKAGPRKLIHVALPGTSGFPTLSKDEQYLYFSHYLNDTNQDGIIDGNDNSVLFRLPLSKLPEKGEVFPEQLTLAESNCSYPRIAGDKLLATCASGGTLDLFELPATGIVPAHWDAAKIWNAHRTARTYAERILLLNSLKYRFPNHISELAIDERLLSDHMLAGDSAAARYYAKKLQKISKETQATLYELTELLLRGLELKGLQKSEDITREFELQMQELDRKVSTVKAHPQFRDIIRGTYKFLVRRPAEAEAFLKKGQLPRKGVHPIVRQAWFELGELLYAPPHRASALFNHIAEMIQAEDLSYENQIQFAFRLLRAIEARHKDAQGRLSVLRQWLGKLPLGPDKLLQSEKHAQQLTIEKDAPAKMGAWREIDAILSKNRDDYFLKRSLLTRAIQVFDQATEYQFVNLVAGNWLRYTNRGDTEFAPARETVSQSQLDRAYDSLGKNNPDLASNFFYGSLSLTDDLESHSGYIRAMIQRGQRTTLNERYKNLEERQFLTDNRLFVDALLGLMDAAPVLSSSPNETAPFDIALEKLERMSQDRDSDMRHLFMGYCKLEKLERLGRAYEVDRALFEEAHRHFMLALDLARDNARVTASALWNLGILHARLQNHGMAARFFEKRATYGFLNAQEEADFLWLQTRSLLRSYQEAEAATGLEKFLASKNGSSLTSQQRAPFEERLAFLYTLIGKYEAAEKLYRNLMGKKAIQGAENLAKAQLNLGRSLLKQGKDTSARAELSRALEWADQVANSGQNNPSVERFTGFEPRRLQLITLGFLGQIGSPKEKLIALERRISLLDHAGDFLDEALTQKVRAQAQAATFAREGAASPANATGLWKALFSSTQALFAQLKAPDPAVIQALKLFLVDGVVLPREHESVDIKAVETLVKDVQTVISKLLFPQADFDAMSGELELLWVAYQARMNQVSPAIEVGKALERLQTRASWKRIEDQLPERAKTLVTLKTTLSLH
jgi:hypothetical protein